MISNGPFQVGNIIKGDLWTDSSHKILAKVLEVVFMDFLDAKGLYYRCVEIDEDYDSKFTVYEFYQHDIKRLNIEVVG